jgi:phosphoribosylanthranilate isomerase
MIGDTQLKVCGLRRAEDARLAAELGADYLGFIFYPKSPRHLSPDDYSRLAPALPSQPRRVAVMVEPSLHELGAAHDAGFDFFQVHARHDLPTETVRAWSDHVGPARLWLAPKLPPGTAFPAAWLPLADTFLVDTFHADGFGGSGRTGDWTGFATLATAHPQKRWILAGGLAPENIAAALTATRARVVDVNSGVETAPGFKSADKLRALAAALRAPGASPVARAAP